MKNKVAIIGSNGIPARYGGFETLAENLVENLNHKYNFIVYCSNIYKHVEKRKHYKGAKLIYLPFKANGFHSIIYDTLSLIHSFFIADVLLILGPVAGFILPLNIFFKKKIITNYGGLNEWEREKYSVLGKRFIYFSFKIATKYSNVNIADNIPLQKSLKRLFNINAKVIEYGGDHIRINHIISSDLFNKYPFLKYKYDLSISRAQKDNNLHILLKTYSELQNRNLVMISNWSVSKYGQELKQKYSTGFPNIFLFDAIYYINDLDVIRSNASLYIHTHSKCGTSPSLVEAMNYNLPVICFDVNTNRLATKQKSIYFDSEESLKHILNLLSSYRLKKLEQDMSIIASKYYRWTFISEKYEKILNIL